MLSAPLQIHWRIGKKNHPEGWFFVDGDPQTVQAAEAKAALNVALGHMMALSFSGEG